MDKNMDKKNETVLFNSEFLKVSEKTRQEIISSIPKDKRIVIQDLLKGELKRIDNNVSKTEKQYWTKMQTMASALLRLQYQEYLELPPALTRVETSRLANDIKHNRENPNLNIQKRTKKQHNQASYFKNIKTAEDLEKKEKKIIAIKTENNKEPIAWRYEFAPNFRHAKTKQTGNNEWNTPTEYLEKVRAVFNGQIDLDPTSNKNAQTIVNAKQFYTKQDDALKQDWRAENVFMNPPYSKPLLEPLADKFLTHLSNGDVKQGIILTHSYTDSEWAHKLFKKVNIIFFTKGRIDFLDPDTNKTKTGSKPVSGQMFMGFNVDTALFTQNFTQGIIFIPTHNS